MIWQFAIAYGCISPVLSVTVYPGIFGALCEIYVLDHDARLSNWTLFLLIGFLKWMQRIPSWKCSMVCLLNGPVRACDALALKCKVQDHFAWWVEVSEWNTRFRIQMKCINSLLGLCHCQLGAANADQGQTLMWNYTILYYDYLDFWDRYCTGSSLRQIHCFHSISYLRTATF